MATEGGQEETVEGEEKLKCAGEIADDLSHHEMGRFQYNPYTFVRIMHVAEDGVAYAANGWTFCSPPDTFDPEWGVKNATLRAKRKIAQRLVWEREAPAVLAMAEEEARAARREVRKVKQLIAKIETVHLTGETVDLG